MAGGKLAPVGLGTLVEIVCMARRLRDRANRTTDNPDAHSCVQHGWPAKMAGSAPWLLAG
jgi:hypothetical protein